MTAACMVCGSPAPTPFLARPAVPVHQNLLMATPEEARAIPRGDLDLRACERCEFLGNVAFREELLQYGPDYEGTQSASPTFDRYVDGLISVLLNEGVRGQRVLEIGCGKGDFLRRLCERGANTGLGLDPSYDGPATAVDGRVRFVKSFLSAGDSMDAEVVVCRHVIEHVRDPVGFLHTVRKAVATGTVVYFETPALEWILEGTVIWDFFYEHCSYFTEASLRNAFRAAGFAPEEVRRVFRGQYLWLRAKAVDGPGQLEPHRDAQRLRLEGYRRAEAAEIERWHQTVGRLGAGGGLAVWGAGAKGITFVNLLDREGTRIQCLIDINPAKDGRYAPGTAHRILSPAAAAPRITDAVLMNPNYLEESRKMMMELRPDVRLHVTGAS